MVNAYRSTFHDKIRGTIDIWPGFYDGRAIAGASYQDHASGISLEDNLKKYNAAKDAGDQSRTVTWA